MPFGNTNSSVSSCRTDTLTSRADNIQVGRPEKPIEFPQLNHPVLEVQSGVLSSQDLTVGLPSKGTTIRDSNFCPDERPGFQAI
jgi:hypothetical protein